MSDDPCDHSQHYGLASCPGLTPAEIAFGEKVRSVALNFVASCGREQWHGPTVKEQVDEHFAQAEKFGHEPPQYEGRAVLV